jgi:hypothetical protein
MALGSHHRRPRQRRNSEKGGIAMVKDEKSRISGKEAAYVALDAAKYPPVQISEVDSSANGSDGAAVMEKLPAPVSDQPGDGERRQAPPRVRKPSPIHDPCAATRWFGGIYHPKNAARGVDARYIKDLLAEGLARQERIRAIDDFRRRLCLLGHAWRPV